VIRPQTFCHQIRSTLVCMVGERLVVSESFPGGSTTVGNLSVMITKRTGVVTEIDEIFGFDEGMQTKQWFPPTIDSGHCSLEQP
jgi:hypothetical protein